MYYYPQNNYNWAPQQEPQRVQQGYQQNMVQQQNMTPQQQIVIQGYPVPDEMTARNATVSTDGNISIFPDIQHGKIYTKQLDMNTFAPIFKVYQLVEQQQNSTNYVCVEEFQKLQNCVADLENKINHIKTVTPFKTQDKKGVKDNVQSNANDEK